MVNGGGFLVPEAFSQRVLEGVLMASTKRQRQNLTAHKQALSGLRQQLLALQGRFDLLIERNAILCRDSEALQSANETLDKALDAATSEVAELRSARNSLVGQLTRAADEISTLRARVDASDGQYDSVSKLLNVARRDYVQLRNAHVRAIEAMAWTHDDLQADLDADERRLTRDRTR